MRKLTPFFGSMSFVIAVLLSLSSCSTVRLNETGGQRKLASVDQSLNSTDVQCYRDVKRSQQNLTDFPWGADGPVVMSIGEAWTERFGTSDEYDAENKRAIVKWYPQYGERYAIVDNDIKLMLELPPYSTAGFMKACPNSTEQSVDLVDIMGKRYLISTGSGFFSAVYDPTTLKPMFADSTDLKLDACVYKESKRQTLQYKGWEKDIQLHGSHVISVNIEGKTPYLPTTKLPQEFEAALNERLNSGFVSALQAVFYQYQNRVKAQKVKMRARTQAPYFEEDKTPPPYEDLFKQLEIESCSQSQFFKPTLDSIRNRIKNCAEAYSRLYVDCSQ